MKKRILLGVTADTSLGLMSGFPEYLAAQGWDVHVVSSPGPKSIEASKKRAYTTHTINMARNPNPISDIRALVEWVRLFQRVKPTIISVGTPKAGLLGAVAGLITRVPNRVYMLRGLRYETSRAPIRQMYKLLEKVTCWCSHSVLAVSNSLRDLVIVEALCPPQKISVVGKGSSNGVDLERFRTNPEERRAAKAAAWPDSPDTPVIGFIGRLHVDKGIDLLLETAKVLKQSNTEFRLLIVGGADSSYNYEETARNSNLQAKFTGKVPDIAPYLRTIDLLCLPTKREGFPNVVLEAAAAGVPTVATPATGIADAIMDDQTGLIAARRTVTSLAAAIAELLTDVEKRRSLGLTARKRVEEEFSNQIVWRRYSKYYQDSIRET